MRVEGGPGAEFPRVSYPASLFIGFSLRARNTNAVENSRALNARRRLKFECAVFIRRAEISVRF